MKILQVKPRSDYRHYSNSSCQGTLMQQSDNWPTHRPYNGCCGYGSERWRYGYEDEDSYGRDNRTVTGDSADVPCGCGISSGYLDRMMQWDSKKFDRCWEKHLCNGGGYNSGFDSDPDKLIAFAKDYFEVEVIAVRTTYYYNVSSGYDCPVIEYIYKKEKSKCQTTATEKPTSTSPPASATA